MMGATDGGKGSGRRIHTVDEDRWDMVFKRKKQNTEKTRYLKGQKGHNGKK